MKFLFVYMWARHFFDIKNGPQGKKRLRNTSLTNKMNIFPDQAYLLMGILTQDIPLSRIQKLMVLNTFYSYFC